MCLRKLFWSFLTILNGLKNNLILQILRWYKQLRFKDIVQEFEKLKKIIEKSEMELNGFEDRKR